MKLRQMKHRLAKPTCYTLMWLEKLPSNQFERHQKQVWSRVKPKLREVRK